MLNLLIASPPPRELKDFFVTHSLRSTVVLKACGFIETERARIIDVTLGELHLQIGPTWLERLWGTGGRGAVSVRLQIQESADATRLDPDRYTRPAECYSTIDVSLRPLGRGWTTESFHQEARRLGWLLRSHFLSC